MLSLASSSFLITPNVGLMIWTLVVFGISVYILARFVYPRITDALDSRANAIEQSIDDASKLREEADALLADYRQRLAEARGQAEEIITRAQRAAEVHERESRETAVAKRDEMLEQTRRDIEAETRKAIQDIRREVADLTVMATEKVTRRVLTAEDQRRLVQDALSDLDFSALSGASENN
jgi:F-type H+-transporting ATPase subunit b